MIIGIVAARGGSKGFPEKNKAILNGKSLVAHAVEALVKAKLVDRVIISTDDLEIAELAIEEGANLIGYRPKELANDLANILSVLKYECEQFEKHKTVKVDGVVLASPTSPFRLPKHVDEALALLMGCEDADCIVSVDETPHRYSIESQLIIGDKGFAKPLIAGGDKVLRRQDKTVSFSRNGPCILALKRSYLLDCQNMYEGKTLLYKMPEIFGLDIDNEKDLQLAKAILKADLLNDC